MSISVRDRKLLWGKAGNRCSYRYGDEVCNQLLFFEDNGKHINGGEECHIVGEKPDAARYIADFAEREAYSNKMLMCQKHHKVIDDHEEVYSIDVLREMKLQHEQAIALATGGKALPSISVPNLTLRMFRLDDRSHLYQENLSFDFSSESLPWMRVFGFVLENTVPSSVAKHISIRVSISWGGGEELQMSPGFDVPARVIGWKADPRFLVNEFPAILTFEDANFASLFGHPKEWSGFQFAINQRWRGFLRLAYSVSSVEPFTENSGELIINVMSHS